MADEPSDFEETNLFSFESGIRVLRGRNAVTELADELSSHDCRRPLLVTDAGIVEAGILDRVTDSLTDRGVDYVVFDGVHSNPRTTDVVAAQRLLEGEHCDCVVGLGGGSSIDTAKAAALLTTNEGTIMEYEGIDEFEQPPLPIIAVPTTVGTGSEVTQSMVISDEADDEKVVVIGESLGPDTAILDPELLDSLPANLVATTGVDSITQAVEAYVSARANPITRALSLRAFEILSTHLRSAVTTGDRSDLARLQVATTMQGMALTNSGLGLVHGLSNTVGGYFDTNHGATNAALLPHVLSFNRTTCIDEYATLASKMGVDTGEMSNRTAAAAFIDEIEALLADVNLDVSLSSLGVEEEAIEQMAADAVDHVDSRANPREYTERNLVRLYEEAY